MTIAGANTVILTVAATLCGLFTVLALSVRQIRKEAHGALLRTLRLFGFSIGYLVIGVVYIPIRVLDCAHQAWPSYSDDDEDDYDDDDGKNEGGDADSGRGRIRGSRRKKNGGGDHAGYGYYDEGCSTCRDMLLATSSSNYTRSNSDISDLELSDTSDLEKGVVSAGRNKTTPC
ncbi:hypothetical protein PG996_014315 [Apiospora saccharicola]|uniref:Uncharacterized protein n=1 Tax=Apiospora saccharicola TaxID=335842 RepID=A0ABR1TJY8_9PEZI